MPLFFHLIPECAFGHGAKRRGDFERDFATAESGRALGELGRQLSPWAAEADASTEKYTFSRYLFVKRKPPRIIPAAVSFHTSCALDYAPSCMRQKRLTVIGAPISFATPARYFSTVCSPSAT